MMTSATPDCRPQPGGTSPALELPVIAVKPSKEGGWQGLAATGVLSEIQKKNIKTLFFDACL
jgi:hypothetical protein